MTIASPSPSERHPRKAVRAVLIAALVAAAFAPAAAGEVARGLDTAAVDHLVISEIVTGGASASDELIEVHNPTAAALPLEGLEVIYVTATGATITRRAAWALGAPSVPPGGHVLIANASGMYAPIADVTYASGMAATGGSVAIRILGATTAIDAAGWGTAASAWMEGMPASAPAASASIERLPGGALGSGKDTDDNAVDFAERASPDPQNLGSPPTPGLPAATPSALPSPTLQPPGSPGSTLQPTLAPSATPSPSPRPQPTPTPMPTATLPGTMTIAEARTAPDGSIASVEAVALTASDFHDGGGFVADATGGIAVLVTDGTFGRGQRLQIRGEVDDRFSQRTLRTDGGSVEILGTAAEPAPTMTTTGTIGESLEGRLVASSGAIVGSPTTLSSGLAFDVDDGTGAARVLVGTATGIDTAGWQPGMIVSFVGVSGQRDSSGSGTDGYRVLLRDAADVIGLAPSVEPSPSPGEGGDGVTSIGAARRTARNTELTVRGVVTLPSDLVDEGTAVIQDSTGAILLRFAHDAGGLRLGARVEVQGKRSTLSGMETLRVSDPIEPLGSGPEPAARQVRTGNVGENDEAMLVVARGAVVASARRSSTGTVSFEIDDGTGPLRVSLAPRLRADGDSLSAGTWVEVRGVLGQETSLARPNEGYRIWPRSAGEVRVTAPAKDPGGGDGGSSGGGPAGGAHGDGSGGATGSLGDLGAADLEHLRIGATLVVGRWRELGVGGLLWDGSRLVAVHASSRDVVARVTRDAPPPIALDLGGLQAAGADPVTGAPVLRLGPGSGQTMRLDAPPSPPRAAVDGSLPAWVSVVGHLSGSGSRRVLTVDGARVLLDERCRKDDDDDRARPRGAVAVTGVALGDPIRLLVPCGGLRSAPSIVGHSALVVAGKGRNGATPQPVSAAASPAGNPGRPIASGLLMAAAGVLAVGAALQRRRRRDGDEPENEGEEDAALGSEPKLTLVRVPNEGGP